LGIPAPSALGGDADRVRRDLQRADAQLVELRLPGGLIGKLRLSLRGQLADHRARKSAVAHVIQRRLVDHVVAVARRGAFAVARRAAHRCRPP